MKFFPKPFIILMLLFTFGFTNRISAQGPKKHLIIFYNNQFFNNLKQLDIVSEKLNTLLRNHIRRMDESYLTFCTYDTGSQSLQTGNVVETRLDNQTRDSFFTLMRELADNKAPYFGSVSNAFTSLESKFAPAPNKMLFDSCFVIAISKTEEQFNDNTLNKCNVESSISDSLHYYTPRYRDTSYSYTFKLYNVTPSCKLFKKNTVTFNTDRRTTRDNNLELFLVPGNKDSTLDVSAAATQGNTINRIHLLSIASNGFGGNDASYPFNSGWPMLYNEAQTGKGGDPEIKTILSTPYNAGDVFPFYDIFKNKMRLQDNGMPLNLKSTVIFTYTASNDIYSHILYHDTVSVQIETSALKKLPFSGKLIDNNMLKTRANGRIITQDQVLWEAYTTNKWLIIGLIAIVLLLAAGSIWWIYVGRYRRV